MTDDDQAPTLLPIARAADRRIGWVSTCTAIVDGPHVVAGSCGNVTTHVRLLAYPDQTRRWRSVCPEHTEGDIR
jgi:hypothetical protein